MVLQVLAEKLLDYPTSIEEDRAALQKPDLTNRQRMAVEVRLGEKLLLEEALTMLKARMAVGLNESEERPAKKVKSRA